jgi:hypothetical protein
MNARQGKGLWELDLHGLHADEVRHSSYNTWSCQLSPSNFLEMNYSILTCNGCRGCQLATTSSPVDDGLCFGPRGSARATAQSVL